MKDTIVKFHFYDDNDIISKFIKWRTHGKYAHVSIEMEDYTYEAKAATGVTKSDHMYTHNKIGSCIATLHLDMQDSERFYKFKQFLEEQVGLKYDFYAILNFLGNWNKNNPKKWFCSELADCVWKFLPKYKAENELVPPDLFYHKVLSYITALKSVFNKKK